MPGSAAKQDPVFVIAVPGWFPVPTSALNGPVGLASRGNGVHVRRQELRPLAGRQGAAGLGGCALAGAL
jgi:hypothetical protein